MRERLTVAFVLLAITVVIGAGAVRSYTILNLLRDDSAAHLREHAELISGLLEERVHRGRADHSALHRVGLPAGVEGRLHAGPGRWPRRWATSRSSATARSTPRATTTSP